MPIGRDVRPSVRPSVRHTFVSALYLLNPCWYLQITLHKCQVWWDDVQCLCLTKVGSRSRLRSQFKIKHLLLYFVSALYLLNPWWDLQITLYKCQVWWDDVQCVCLTKVGSRSRSQSKIKHCMTVFRVRSLSFEPLVGFTNKTLLKCQLCCDDVQCLCLTKVGSRSRSEFKIKHCMTVFHIGSIFWTPGWIYKLLCTNFENYEMICSAYSWQMSVQGQGHSLRFNIVWLYLVFALYLLNPWWYLQITLKKMSAIMRRCAMLMFDQGQLKVKVKV